MALLDIGRSTRSSVRAITPSWRGPTRFGSGASGTLAANQWIDGVPCRAGHAAFDKFATVFDKDGVVQRCTLAASHELFGLTLPPGTTVWRGIGSRPWRLLQPADAGLFIPAITATAPPGVTLAIADGGRLEGIDSGHGQTIIVSNILLSSRSLLMRSGRIIAQLAERFFVAGAMCPAGTGVAIDLRSGNATLATGP
jgi:hypothetical protein